MTIRTLKPVARLKPDVVLVPLRYLVERELDDDLVIYNPRTDETHILNGTAAIVWWLTDGNRSVAEIGLELAKVHGLDPADVASDVGEVLHGFTSARLATW
ncbi:MAG: PqqD family protein [Chloroflexi bacterium]|nr:PqqD family protein [Chloroflexota bacterium]